MIQQNGGADGPTPVQHGRGRVSEQAYEHLRDSILRRELPVGSILAETAVAAQLGVSRTPVRQALRMLLQEGLVSVGPRRQLVVQGVSPEQREETFLVREALEDVSVSQACKVMSVDDIDQLRLLLLRARRAADAGDVEGFIDIDEEFHRGIAVGARLNLVDKTIEQLRAFVRLMGVEAVVGHKGRMLEVIDEHSEILDAIEARDRAAARKAMKRHLDISRVAMQVPLGDAE